MKWFFKWFAGKLRDSTLNVLQSNLDIRSTNQIDVNGIHLIIHRANGGFVVQQRFYDRLTDVSEFKLYIIADDQDLGEEIGKIITIGSLYR